MPPPAHIPDLEHFLAIPWCAAHLRQPGVTAVVPASRRAKPTTEDSLFGQTINTPGTIAAFVLFYEDVPPSASSSSSPSTSSQPVPQPRQRIDEVKAFLTLGSGLNGYPAVCHGGMVTAILDEVLGLLPQLNRQRRPKPAPTPTATDGTTPTNTTTNSLTTGSYMTAYLNTTFLAPVRTPSTVLVTARVVRTEGRKLFVEGDVWDSEARRLARAEALFVALRGKL